MKYILIILILFVFGCNKLESGTVVGKRYEEARTYVTIIPITISNGKTTSIVPIPYTIYDDEDYIISISGIHNGEIKYEEYYVDKETFDQYDINFTFKTQNYHNEDTGNSKTRVKK